eukprot:GEMP01014080.1.p1 GENE.GEMP01014080.1~~GEMP01014080.1.p1  ORF type:complete len:723 (+),score=194.76 GEMP01014080.1:110-2278(+)
MLTTLFLLQLTVALLTHHSTHVAVRGAADPKDAPAPPAAAAPAAEPSDSHAQDAADTTAGENDHDELFGKKEVKKVPSDLDGYCAAGGNQDPACDVNAPVKELKNEIMDVFKHIRQMLEAKKKKRDEQKAEEEAASGEKDTAKAAETAKVEDADKEMTKAAKGPEGKSEQEKHKVIKAHDAEESKAKDAVNTGEEKSIDRHAHDSPTTDPEVDHIVSKGKSIEDKIKEIEDLRRTLVDDGKMDPELDKEMDHLIDDGKIMQRQFEQLQHLDGDSDMIGTLEKLEDNAKKTAGAVNSLQTGVAPNEWKWWRYRYEYSFVESTMLFFAIFAVLLVDLVHHAIQARLFKPDDQDGWMLIQNAADSKNMSRRWLCLMFGELSVILFVQCTLWLIAALHLLEYLPTSHAVGVPGMHLPREETEYLRVVQDIFVQLFVCVFVFYLLMATIIWAAEKRIRSWDEYDVMFTPRDPATRVDPMSDATHHYAALRTYFTSALREDKQLWVAVGSPRAIDIDNFPFCKYLTLSVRGRVEDHMCVNTLTWFGIMCTCALVCCLNYFWHVPFLHVSAGISLCVFLCIGVMAYQVHRIRQSVGHFEETKEKGAVQNISHMKSGDFYMAKLFQFLLFSTCYGFARIVASPFMWTLYPLLATSLVTAFVCFFALFVLCFSVVIPEFSALMSVPPYVSTEKALHISMLLDREATDMIHKVERQFRKSSSQLSIPGFKPA